MTPKARIAPAGRGVSRPVADAVEAAPLPEPLDQPRPLARAAARRPGHPGPPRRRGGASGPRDHPVADDGRVLLIDHYRFTTGTRGWEIPSGGNEPGESVHAAGRCELLEETGHAARRWTTLGRSLPWNGSSDLTVHVVMARRLRRLHEPLDRNETVALRRLSTAEVRRGVLATPFATGCP